MKISLIIILTLLFSCEFLEVKQKPLGTVAEIISITSGSCITSDMILIRSSEGYQHTVYMSSSISVGDSLIKQQIGNQSPTIIIKSKF